MRYGSENLIKKFREKRAAAKISQRELSTRSGLTQSHISQIETGSLDPGLSSFLQMARALDLELALLPRKLMPAVEAIERANEVSLNIGFLPKQDLVRLEQALDDYKRLGGVSGTVAEVEDLVDFFQRVPLSQKDLKGLRRFIDELADGARRPSRKHLEHALSGLKMLRNHMMHPRAEAPRPAYSANDEDDDA